MYIIYFLDTMYEPNILILAQSFFQILCSKGPLWVKRLSLKRAIIRANFVRI